MRRRTTDQILCWLHPAICSHISQGQTQSTSLLKTICILWKNILFLISDRFHNFQRLAMWDEIFGYILAFTIYIYIIKLLHMLKYFPIVCLYMHCHWRSNYQEMTVEISLIGLILLHFCTCLQAITCILGFFVCLFKLIACISNFRYVWDRAQVGTTPPHTHIHTLSKVVFLTISFFCLSVLKVSIDACIF
jgi:hypothetical protein